MNNFLILILAVLFYGCGNDAITTAESSEVDIDGFLKHLEILSDDQLFGRDTGSPGYDSAALYIETFARELALEPGGLNDSYHQPIRFRRSSVVQGSTKLVIDDIPLESLENFALSPNSDHNNIDLEGPLVFAGFGIHAPELGYSDFDSIDVSGKIVMIVRGAPLKFDMVEQAVTSSAEESNQLLKSRGALAVLRVFPESYYSVRSWQTIVKRMTRPKLRYIDESTGNHEIPSLVLNIEAAKAAFQKSGKKFSNVLNSLSNGNSINFEFGVEVQLSAQFDHQPIECNNLAGIIEGSDPVLKDEFLIMTAHLDHIGVNVLAQGDSINNGTLDNASGAAALMVMAKAFKQLPAPRRSIMFLWLTAEEKGLLGSEYFTKYPTVAPGKIMANLNIDGIIGMIVETRDVIAYGYEHSNLSKSVDYAVKQLDMQVSPDPLPEQNIFVRSDQYSFVKQGYPALYVVSGRTAVDPNQDGLQLFNNWLKDRYHQPSDDMQQPMSRGGMEQELKLNFLIAHHVANQLDTIKWNHESFLYKRFVAK